LVLEERNTENQAKNNELRTATKKKKRETYRQTSENKA